MVARPNQRDHGRGDLYFGSTPEVENDVIALFSELVALGALSQFEPVFFSDFDYYDSFFEYKPDRVHRSYSGVFSRASIDLDERDLEGVAEFPVSMAIHLR